MKITRWLLSIAVLLVLIVALRAQAPPEYPDHFAAAGLGFQATGTQHESGWITLCAKVASTNRVFACGATDYQNNASTVRAEILTALYRRGPVVLFGKGGAGIAIGASGSTGASFSGGGAVTYDIERFTKIKGAQAVGSVTLVKNNVSVIQTGSFGFLKGFGQETVWRAGFGKTW